MKEVSAIILAAGKGTRMKSTLAKVLHPVLGRPMITYPLDAARAVDATRLVIVVGHQAEEVTKAVAASDVAFAVQAEQLGTADAVAKARPALEGVSGTALIICGDTPLLTGATLGRLLAAHRRQKALVTVLTMTPADPFGYGRIVRDSSGHPARIVEERDASAEEKALTEVNTGAYAVELPWLWSALLGVGTANSQGEYYLTDIVAKGAAEGRARAEKLANPVEALGINSRGHLAEATKALRERINAAWMEEGVTLDDPATTWIEPGVTLSPDVTLGPNVRLEGATTVASGAIVGQGAVITDSEIGPGVIVKPYSVVNGAKLLQGAQAGPFAHLRPGALLCEKAKVGNYVEIKKTTLGRGAKASHLTYLGDATVGENANIGAGTITCNYDGVNKFQTHIGAGAFIGSNTSLVAPVRVGDCALVAAGSVITEDVPGRALGVARSQQKNVEGWRDRVGPKGGEGK